MVHPQDEFAVQKGYKYMTVVMDLENGRVLYVGEGKTTASLDDFWKRVRYSGARIEAVAMDIWPAFMEAVTKKIPDARIIFYRFHIIKMVNDALSKLRRDLYHQETKINKRSVIKGIRWLLPKREDNLKEEKDERKRLQLALEVNKPLAIAYYLKEGLSLLWSKESVEQTKYFKDKHMALEIKNSSN